MSTLIFTFSMIAHTSSVGERPPPQIQVSSSKDHTKKRAPFHTRPLPLGVDSLEDESVWMSASTPPSFWYLCTKTQTFERYANDRETVKWAHELERRQKGNVCVYTYIHIYIYMYIHIPIQCRAMYIWQILLKMLHPRDPPNRKFQIPRYKFKLDQIFNSKLHYEILGNPSFWIQWILRV